MSMATSLESYQVEQEILDRAVASSGGIKIKLESQTSALNLRNRLNYCRSLDRKENQKIYEKGDYMFGKSHYDELIVRVIDGTVVIEKPKPIGTLEIEEL